jgi:enoyl-CoA hydratase/carnithine racemase
MEGVATLTLERPEVRNALSAQMCDEIVSALEGLDPATTGVVVLSGAGETFCAGADLAAVSGPKALEFLPAFERMLDAVELYPLPTIARIQGAALGGGFQLATVCDFRVATATARLGIPSPRIGIVINYENVERLVLLLGIAIAKEILMAGRTLIGEEAREAGFVTGLTQDAELDDAVWELARSIASLSPLSVQGAKQAIGIVRSQMSSARRGAPDQVSAIDELVAGAYKSDDLAEGMQAMSEKRPPNFEGR